MLELTDPEMITLGIGGAVLMGTCASTLDERADRNPFIRLGCWGLGLIMLGIALLDMVTN